MRAAFDAAGYDQRTQYRRVTSVTFPRSGHHLLARLLARYYWRRPAASTNELWRRSPWRGGFHYCLNYDHCQRTPCVYPWNNFQKQHDFGLLLPREAGENYLIQYRHPLDSLTSRFHMETSWLRSCEDKEEIWRAKSAEWGLYWKGFVRKWAMGPTSPNVLLLSYENLVSNPSESLRSVVKFISPSRPLDEDLLIASVEAEKPSADRDLTAFRYFDEGYFRAMESELLPEMSALGILPRFQTEMAPAR